MRALLLCQCCLVENHGHSCLILLPHCASVPVLNRTDEIFAQILVEAALAQERYPFQTWTRIDDCSGGSRKIRPTPKSWRWIQRTRVQCRGPSNCRNSGTVATAETTCSCLPSRPFVCGMGDTGEAGEMGTPVRLQHPS